MTDTAKLREMLARSEAIDHWAQSRTVAEAREWDMVKRELQNVDEYLPTLLDEIDTLRARVGELEGAVSGYRAAVSYIGADSWDGCSDCIDVLKAASAADIRDPMANDDVAANLARLRPLIPARTALQGTKP